jgi:ADP-heptose:LPS heptosyltransferase
MMSNHPEIFAGADDTPHVIPVAQWREAFARVWGRSYVHLEYASMESEDRSTSPKRHIIAELCARAGVSGSVDVRPYLALTDKEKTAAAWAKGRIVIQSSGLSAKYPMRNKQWFSERYQSVVDALSGEFEFVQLGSPADPPLEHVADLRGATSIRQTAAILHHARLYIGNVGFLMHLARAVECPSVIIYGGREAPWQSGYPCNMNLYTELPCAPCWRWNTCDYDHKCMRDIMAEDAIFGIRQMLKRARNPLTLESVEIA